MRKLLLARPEWQVIEACDGREAVQKATELSPDIVLLDIEMPILNGVEAAEKIREVTSSSKLIFLTMNGDDDVTTAALSMGAEAHLIKANAVCELVSTISAALEGQD